MSSPVGAMMNSCLEQMGAGGEFYTFFDEEKRQNICRMFFEAYYQEQHQGHEQNEDKIIFDTNRSWTSRLHQLVPLFKNQVPEFDHDFDNVQDADIIVL